MELLVGKDAKMLGSRQDAERAVFRCRVVKTHAQG